MRNTLLSSTRFLLFSSCALLIVLAFAGPLPAFSQSCALCYTQAAASTSRFIQALRSGILILVIPPVFTSVVLTVMTYRKRHHYYDRRSQNTGGW